MNLDSLSFTLSQISYLVANLSKKNYEDSCQEISVLVQWNGLEADRHFLRCLISCVDFSKGELSESSAKDYFQAKLLKQECNSLLSKPSFISNLCFAIDNPLHQQKSLNPSPKFFVNLKKTLGLTLVQEVAFAIALQHSENTEIRLLALEHTQKQLPELIKNYINSETSNKHHEGGLHDSLPQVLQLILSQVFHTSNPYNLPVEAKEKFVQNLRRDFPRELVPVVLAPFLYPGDGEPQFKIEFNMAVNQMDNNTLVELIMELGYSFTSSVDECRSSLAGLGAREISPACVARVLAHMARSCSNLEDAGGLQSFWGNSATSQDSNKDKPSDSTIPTTWNVEVFIQTLKEMQSTLSWNDVIVKLDHPEFIIKDRQGLSLLITGLKLGLQHQGYPPDMFPVELFYRHWDNVEGQFSLIQQILKCPDIFCFADYPYHSVTVDVLKAAPESDSKEGQTWRSLNIVELLLHMAERGLYNSVQEIFKWPVQHCPDVLVLALLQINPPLTLLRQELFTTLLPIFLGNHPNSAVILHHAWHANNTKIKTIIMHAMADWYTRGDHDQTRLSRILDVAQDLKALSALLNSQSFPFVIDLACLASRREYLKLEKWLTDKIRDHGEVFVAACVKFLQRRCPQVMGPGIKEDPTVPKASQLPQETLTTILACLQVCAGSVSQELSELIMTMVQNCSLMLSKSTMNRPPPPGVLRHRGLEPFNPATLGSQLFSSKQVDPLGNLSSSLATMGLGTGLGPPSSSTFNLPGALGPLVSAPGSPSRLMGPSPSPFPMLPLSSQLHSGPVGTQGPSVLPGGTIGGLGRLGPPTGIEKARIPETSNLFPDMGQNVSKEVEDEANSYFQRIYNHPPHPTLSIDEVLDMLKKFQDSGSRREREVFNCMLRNLFEEYRFFPQYPEKELQITAQLFGGIIERGLVNSYMTLGLALRFVLDALKKPEGSKMYYFGITALDRFKSRLKDYQTYCEHVRTIPHFNEFPPHLIEYIEYGLQGQEPPSRPQGPVLPKTLAAMLAPVTTPYKTMTTTTITTSTTQAKPSTTPTTSLSARPSMPSVANATNIDTLLVATDKEEKITTPPEALQDKTAFIFNNLSQLNLQQKCDEIREIVTEEYWPWMAQYLVMKRASIELNFHALYSNFLDCIKLPEVNKMVTRETFRNIKVLLRSDKGIANFSDRSLLKNLGHWLGMLTLGRNKPILQIDIDLKSLLVEAYHKGQQELLYVVPFVAKVLESCAKSRVFRPPNPWTMAIMNVLAELHQEPDLKLNLKFEIEVLCKNLSIDVGELKPVIYLKDPEKLRNLEYQLSHPNKKAEPPSNQQQSQGPIEELVGPTTSAGTVINPQSAPPVNTTPSLPTGGAPEPRFNYMDISVTGIANISQHITINNQLPLFQTHPHLKQFVRPAVERAIQEWIHPVVDRSIKIALTTSEQIVKKDFALDPEELRIRTAGRNMVRNLTAGMAMITCRDQILASISTNLKQALLTALIGTTPQQKELAEQAANVVAADNMELACAFVQKTAIEKAIPEMDKRLISEMELRKIARQEGRRYCDPLAKYQAERMPEQIRLKVGGVTPQQMAVYEEFARNIPGFLPLSERDTQALFMPKPINETPVTAFTPNSAVAVATAQQVAAYAAAVSNDEVGAMLEKLAAEAELLLAAVGPAAPPPQHAALHSLLESIILTRRSRDAGAAMTLLKKAVEGLLDGPIISSGVIESENLIQRYRELHLRILKCLQDPRAYGMQWTNKHVTRFLTECREEFRYNFEAVDYLIRSHLISLPQYDVALAQAMEAGNAMATAFAMQLVQLYLIDERQATHVTETDLFHTIEILARMAHHRTPPEGILLFRLTSLVDSLRANHDTGVLVDRAPAGPTAHIHSGILQVRARDFDDPPGLMEKTEYLLREWVQMHHSPQHARDLTKAFGIFVHQMNIHGILKTDDLITRFFKLSTQMCVDLCYRALSETATAPSIMRAKCFHSLDAFVRLVALLVKHSGDATNTHTKINLLNKVLGIVAGVLLQDHEIRGTDFQQLPYHRIFIMLFLELCAPEPVLEAVNFQVLTAFCHTLHILRPAKASGFCYAWLELVSHRVFIGRMLAITPQQKCWGMYAQLLIDLFKYLAPYLRNAELAKPVTSLYKGTLRVLLVLLHDFPEFLCDYHYGFCDVIPPNCIQMRNLILSAFPRNMRLPDPFTPNLKVDMLQEIAHAPRVLTNFASTIQPLTFKKELDSYLKARAPVTFLSELRSNLQVSQEAGVRYNIQLMNALVLYVGTQAIAFIRSKGHAPNMSTIAHSAHMDIFQNLAVDLDTEGRYLFLNAIANQLRYPNSHTHYFSCTLLYLFAEANTEAIQEQITRVLLERLIVNRPHPWGLLITFIELIKNPTYKFWSHEFVHCAPEIEKLFESVARSCMVQKQVPTTETEIPE